MCTTEWILWHYCARQLHLTVLTLCLVWTIATAVALDITGKPQFPWLFPDQCEIPQLFHVGSHPDFRLVHRPAWNSHCYVERLTWSRTSASDPTMCMAPDLCRGLRFGVVSTCMMNPIVFWRTSRRLAAAECSRVCAAIEGLKNSS